MECDLTNAARVTMSWRTDQRAERTYLCAADLMPVVCSGSVGFLVNIDIAALMSVQAFSEFEE